MTQKEKIIATAYTGIMFVDGSQIGDVFAYEEEKLGHGVIDIMHACKDFSTKIRYAVKPDFIAMLKGEMQEPIDEEELDRLAKDFLSEGYENNCNPDFMECCKNIYKAGYRKAKQE